jgi:predicted hydrocarbon binding protein
MKYGMPEFGPLMGIQDMSFRLLPVQMKLRTGAEAFARTFSELTGQPVTYAEEGSRVLWIFERCPLCWQRETAHPACLLAVGLLQEATYWISGGRYFHVEEVRCIANGDDACMIAIDKEPMD